MQIRSRDRLRQRAAEDGRVLAEDEHTPTEHLPVPGDNCIADEAVELDEGAGIAQPLGAFAGGQLLAFRVDHERSVTG